MSVFIALYWHLWPTLNPSLSPAATRCMWRRSPLSWRRTVGPYPIWQVSHTVCRCRAMSATLRRIFLPRSWSRTKPRPEGRHSDTNPSLVCVKKKKSYNTLTRKERKEECFLLLLFFLKKLQENQGPHWETPNRVSWPPLFFRRKNKTVEHCFLSVCNTTQCIHSHTTHKHIHMSHHPPWSSQPLRREPQRFGCTLLLASALTVLSGCLTSCSTWRRHTGDVWVRETHTESFVYIHIYLYGAVTRGCEVYPPPTPCQSLFIFFEIIAWFQDRKGWKSAFWRLPPILLTSRFLPEPSARLTWRRWHGPSPCPLFCPPAPPPSPHQDTEWQTSFKIFDSKWGEKKTLFSPQKTAGMGPFGAVLFLSSVCWMEGWAWNTLWTRGWEAQRNEGGRLQKYCDLKKKTFDDYITRKRKCVVAFVISFFFWCCYWFMFDDQYLHGCVRFHCTCLVFFVPFLIL